MRISIALRSLTVIAVVSYGALIHSAPALEIRTSIETDVPLELRKSLPKAVETALTMIKAFPPPGLQDRNLFEWKGERRTLKGKSLTLVLATSHTGFVKDILRNSGARNMDSMTLGMLYPEKRELSLMTTLLVDKIFFDPLGQELPNGFAKLVVALAHEIYGNVQNFLAIGIDDVKRQTIADRVKQQKASYVASILFLGNLQNSANADLIPLKIRQDLLDLMPREIAGLRSWQRAHRSEAMDPTCEAILRSWARDN